MEQKGFSGLVAGTKISSVLEQAKQIARYNRPVLIRGERGTGKELMARFIHQQSQRSDNSFIPVNCAAFSKELLASELYGHEAGAFTGAQNQRRGRLEQAHEGTLFLDEIGNMPMDFQESILRVIEYQSFERLGTSESIHVDVRIVTATNANLEEMIQNNQFKADLFDRISFAQITMPPLRQRRDEIPQLLMFVVKQLQLEMPGLEMKQFSKGCVEALIDYHWPGNIRQFKNTIERLYLSSTPELITEEHLPHEILGQSSNQPYSSESFADQVEKFQKNLILTYLRRNNWNQRATAKALDMSIDSFRHYYKKYKFSKDKDREKS